MMLPEASRTALEDSRTARVSESLRRISNSKSATEPYSERSFFRRSRSAGLKYKAAASRFISSSRVEYPVIRKNASLKSRKRPCGVEMKTPSCTLETRVRYFSSARFRSEMSLRTCTTPISRPAGSTNGELDVRKKPESHGSRSSASPATPSQYGHVL